MPIRPARPPRAVRPLAGAAPYQGGKRNLAARVIQVIESIPHRAYAEPFIGMGGIFFRRRFAPTVEAVNDISRDVVTFFRVLQRHYTPFVEMIRWTLATRADFERLLATEPAMMTDLERAARFYYLQKNAFGGKVEGRTFGIDPNGAARFDVTRLIPQLEELHSRLAGVWIECLPYAQFITRYDRAETLFYIDPPYYGCEDDYGAAVFTRDDFARLAEQLRTISARFIVSLNDTPEVREIFAGFAIESVSTTYSVGSGPTRAKEVLITDGR